MIDYISGKVAELSPTEVVIDNNGIAYVLQISIQTYEQLRGKGEAKVFVYQHARQDNPEEYYGFVTKDERSLFKIIIGVSGIGVASARMILSSMTSDELRSAILSEDVNKIKSVKGIGLKSAQRLILELKDKIVKGEGADIGAIFQNNNDNANEAASALQMLGFSKPNINKAIQNILKNEPQASVEDIIKAALKML